MLLNSYYSEGFLKLKKKKQCLNALLQIVTCRVAYAAHPVD
jgi:hypothetical protein